MQPNQSPIRVLIVDDHKTMLWGLERLINGAQTGMLVVGATGDPEHAVQLARQLRPDVIVLDLDLGTSSGQDILPALQLDGAAHVLLFSGSRDTAALERAVRSGAHGVLNKDASAEMLLKAIDKVATGQLWIDSGMLAHIFDQLIGAHPAHKKDPDAEKFDKLTPAELKIVHAIIEASGALNHVVAERLFISAHTMRNHLASIYKKLGVSNRLELYVYASKHLATPLPS
jgi:two-component system nitrate/nitrite response regulator NarL